MSNQPLSAASLRGAVDLSSLKSAGPAAPAVAPASQQAVPVEANAADDAQIAETFAHDGLVVDVTAENFQALVQTSVQYPIIVAIWAGSQPASRGPIDILARAVRKQEGRVLLGVADLDDAPEIGQVFAQIQQQLAAQGQPAQVQAIGFVQGQPIPIPPVMEDEVAADLLGQVVQIAVQNGITGRVPNYDASAATQGEEDSEPELPATHQLAYDAIDKGDYEGAIAAFEQALKDDPKDEEARLALGQVRILSRTQGLDLQQVREAAAVDPTDVDAQIKMADLDVLGGHVEDAFARLIDTVKATQDADKTKAREHLIGLFDVVGATDPRVKKARTALMSALY